MTRELLGRAHALEPDLAHAPMFLSAFSRMLWWSANEARRAVLSGHAHARHYDLHLRRVRGFTDALASFRDGRFYHVISYLEIRLIELERVVASDLPAQSRATFAREESEIRSWYQYLSGYC